MKILDHVKYLTVFFTGFLFLAIPAYSHHAETKAPAAKTKISAVPGSQKQRINVVCTAYNLLESDCGKKISDPWFGITATGKNLKNKTRNEARVIATDPRIIPMGTKVLLIAKVPEFAKYNGIYTAEDTGNLIKGNRVDIFFGDTNGKTPTEALKFGVREFFAYIM